MLRVLAPSVLSAPQHEYYVDKERCLGLWLPAYMAWSHPQYTKGQVDAAGQKLAKWFSGVPELSNWDYEEFDEMFAIVNNWRSAHNYPPITMRMTLQNRAKSIDNSAVVAQRIKRLSSIGSKLERNGAMKLSQMQDIGGCRAIMKNVKRVKKLVRLYKERCEENPGKGPEFVKAYDYIEHPKPDGYRGVHLIHKYRSRSEKHKAFNGLRIEFQLRSGLQHAWATAVETVGTFTQQALKSNQGDQDWLRFFALMGSAIARREGTPIVPNTPDTEDALKIELKDYVRRLNVEDYLAGYSSALRILEQKPALKEGRYFLIMLDPIIRQTTLTSYAQNELEQASEDYLTVERTMKNANAVLVSAGSIGALQRSYPNYFWDTDRFVDVMLRAIK